MATILPTDWNVDSASGVAARQVDTLDRMSRQLPDTVLVFHGVHWSRPEQGLGSLGDVDFVLLAPSGHLLLVEQKTGLLSETPEGLVKRYRGSHRHVRVDVDRTVDTLKKRLAPVCRGDVPVIQYLLYCPDYQVRDRTTAGLDSSQIVDSTERGALCQRASRLLGDAPDNPELVRRLRRFFSNELELVPDASALVGQANALVTRMSEGLATWARRIEVSPPCMRVVATAGSGKTQLALALLQAASLRGEQALYVCFNRPLADHIRGSAPSDVQVSNYHQWCQQRLRNAGQSVDFAGADSFARIEHASLALPVSDDERVDLLIVDEGQDFSAAWRDDVLRVVRPVSARAVPTTWWLEDPMQDLYGREAGTPSDWPVLRAQVNYRSPRAVVNWINRVLVPPEPIIGAGPVQGMDPEVLVYNNDTELVSQTKSAITMALRAGFRREDIAIITFAGRARSVIHPLDSLGPNQLRKFSGNYDLFGEPEILDGELLLDTVYRFKGQSAPAVVLTEVSFDALDDITRRKLFVGITRASLQVFIVCARQSAALLH